MFLSSARSARTQQVCSHKCEKRPTVWLHLTSWESLHFKKKGKPFTLTGTTGFQPADPIHVAGVYCEEMGSWFCAARYFAVADFHCGVIVVGFLCSTAMGTARLSIGTSGLGVQRHVVRGGGLGQPHSDDRRRALPRRSRIDRVAGNPQLPLGICCIAVRQKQPMGGAGAVAYSTRTKACR